MQGRRREGGFLIKNIIKVEALNQLIRLALVGAIFKGEGNPDVCFIRNQEFRLFTKKKDLRSED